MFVSSLFQSPITVPEQTVSDRPPVVKAVPQGSATYSDALLALGQQMYAAGIDDGELGLQIAALDRQTRRAELAHEATRALEVQRTALLLQLAVLALAEEGPLPGAEAEYARARAAEAVLCHDEENLAAIQPSEGAGWWRRAIAFAGVGGIFCLALWGILR